VHADYDGRQIVGIDLHRRRSVIVRMTDAGQVLDTVRITNEPAALAAEIGKAGEHPDVVLEATYGWYWAVDVLQAEGADVHLAHPLGIKGFAYRRVKNDVRDAADLAGLLRMGRLPEAYVAPPAVRELRELVRHRAKPVAWRSGLKASIHAVLAKQGLHIPVSDLFGLSHPASSVITRRTAPSTDARSPQRPPGVCTPRPGRCPGSPYISTTLATALAMCDEYGPSDRDEAVADVADGLHPVGVVELRA
jgi:hypothetical protein